MCKKTLQQNLSEQIEISESTLYPILKRLENNGHLETYSKEHNSRLRKYYHLTESGDSQIKNFLQEWHQVMEVYNFIKGSETNE